MPDEFSQGRLVEFPRRYKTIEDLFIRDMDIFPADDRLDVLDVPAVQEDPDVPLCLLFMGEIKDFPECPGEIYSQGIFNAEYAGIPAFCLGNIVKVGGFFQSVYERRDIRLDDEVIEFPVVKQTGSSSLSSVH